MFVLPFGIPLTSLRIERSHYKQKRTFKASCASKVLFARKCSRFRPCAMRSIGIEPMTYRLGGGCSILLSYERI